MKKNLKGLGFYLLIMILFYIGVRWINGNTTDVEKLNITQLVESIKTDKVKTIYTKGSFANGELKDGTKFSAYIPSEMEPDFYQNYLKASVESGALEYGGEPPEQRSIIFDFLPTILMLIVLGAAWFMFMNQTQGGGGRVMNFGKSRAKMHKDDPNKVVKFKDVAGLEEEKEELYEIVEFLKNPKKFTSIGARIPKGVLLVGPPGTGKTYISKAVAGEANVPFFTTSGSDFVEMFVGVGATRVRDLFAEAKKNAPCIIFIDEIDAVGRRRGTGLGGGHDEREQTLNQLLVEMDGFGTNEGVIIMAATNRADILDPALLRPGRFDRTVYVGRPDVRGREEILKIHTKKKPLDSDVDLKVIAKRTAGFTPADLENLVNESAILAARSNRNKINMEDIEEASIKVQAGPAKKSRVVSEKERKLTAVHEAGHAVVSKLTPGCESVHMITIIPRGEAGGFTSFLPEDEINFMTKSQMKALLVSLLGGRVAEQVVLGDISTGAGNDIERATNIARLMVTHYGMSDAIGTINYGSDDGNVFVGMEIGKGRSFSEQTQHEIDMEVKNLISEAYGRAEKIIRDNIEFLTRVSNALLERETISGEEFEALFRGEELKEFNSDKNEVGSDKITEKDLTEDVKNAVSKSDGEQANSDKEEDKKDEVSDTNSINL